jgi:hypothetical protein
MAGFEALHCEEVISLIKDNEESEEVFYIINNKLGLSRTFKTGDLLDAIIAEVGFSETQTQL